VDTHTLYRLRLTCDGDDEAKAEHRITHAIAARALVLREIRTENIEDSGTSVIQAILESATHDAELLEALASELRTDPWTKSVEWTETGSEAE
jgi:putative Mg2+ transporter-C (MgtC) family protein